MDSLSSVRWFTPSTPQFPFLSTSSLLFRGKCYTPERRRPAQSLPARTPTLISVLKTRRPGDLVQLIITNKFVRYTFVLHLNFTDIC